MKKYLTNFSRFLIFLFLLPGLILLIPSLFLFLLFEEFLDTKE